MILIGKLTASPQWFNSSYSSTPFIFSGDTSHDEIDIELLGGDPSHWQSNIFAPSPHDDEPLYGVFGFIDDFSSEPGSESDISSFHRYSIDWRPDIISWSVDDRVVRTLRKGMFNEQAHLRTSHAHRMFSIDATRRNNTLHFPTHPLRVQLGIWDASSPAGTAAWAHGPVDWTHAPARSSAIVRSVRVEC
jgi:hypothetical protein